MNTLKSYFLIIILLLTTKSFSQDQNSPWVVSLGINVISLQGDNVDANTAIGIPALGISRYIGGGFSIGGQFALNKISGNSLPQDLSYYSLDGILKYNISTSGSVNPYLFAGYGFSSFEDGVGNKKGPFPSSDVSETSIAGIGLDIDLSDKLALNISSSYRNADERKAYKHFQHVIGVSIKLGSLDSDGDGISDKNDECPDVPGLEEFAGCPDTDGDGIADKDDQCPDQPGTKDMNGCPDSDGDGVNDNIDECPDQAGSISGCPDSDGDGVADKNDECPNQAGSLETDGCPDSDGDGVVDKNDKCPNTAGSKENDGCPVVTDELTMTLSEESNMVKFMPSSSNLTPSSNSVLEFFISVIDKYPNKQFLVEGHASSDGSSSFNQKLSEQRAESVKNALIEKGVDSSRLEAQGFGEDKPFSSNDTSSGRKSNRRVQLSMK